MRVDRRIGVSDLESQPIAATVRLAPGLAQPRSLAGAGRLALPQTAVAIALTPRTYGLDSARPNTASCCLAIVRLKPEHVWFSTN